MRRRHSRDSLARSLSRFAQAAVSPGLTLFCALGLGPLAAALLAWRRNPLAPMATLGVGVALLIWMAVQIDIVGYSNSPPLQPFYLLLGVVITGVGLGWLST